MYKTENFQILIPTTNNVRTYGKKDLILEEGPPMARMARTNKDVDLYMRLEKVWSEKFKEAVQEGKSLFAGPQYRLSSYELLNDGRIKLDLGPTDYREFMGTNVEAGKDSKYMQTLLERGIERYGDKDAFFSNVLSICSVIETSDGKIIAGLRSDKVAEYPRCWHTAGGHPNPTHYQQTKTDLFDSMEREMIGELGIDNNEIENMRLLGLVRNSRTRTPELLFHSKIYVPFNDIKDRRLKSEKDEHFTFFEIDSIEELIDFLNKNQNKFIFPKNSGLIAKEQNKLKPKKHPENTTNFFVPPGEASWVLYLRHNGVDVEKELPYVELVEK